MDTTLVTMSRTERTEARVWIMFYEEISRITNEKAMAMNMPLVAPLRNSLSDAPQLMANPPLNLTFFMLSGVESRFL